MPECVFCSIARHTMDADTVFEDDDVIAFRDRRPIAPVHVLVIPKEHIASVADFDVRHRDLAGKLVMTAKSVAEQEGIAGDGYKLLFRVKRHGGQEVDHVHLHLIGGAPLTEIIRPR